MALTTERVTKQNEVISYTDIPLGIVTADTSKSPTDYTGCLCIVYEDSSNN